MSLIAGFHDGKPVYIEAPKAVPAPGVKVATAEVATDAKGNVVIAFAKMNVIDADGDVTIPGAFPSTEVPLSQWGHASWQPGFLPIGRGRISEERGRAIFRGKMFLGTQAGRESFDVLRELGPLSEFSYGYTIPDGGADFGSFDGKRVRFLRKLLVHEVSPVLRGAGRETGVIEMSSLDPAQLAWQTAVADNERELLRLQGYTAAARRRVGTFDGRPVYIGTGGRK